MPSRINRSQRKMKRRSRRSRSRRQNKKQFGGRIILSEKLHFAPMQNPEGVVQSYAVTWDEIGLNTESPLKQLDQPLLNQIYNSLEEYMKIKNISNYTYSIIVKNLNTSESKTYYLRKNSNEQIVAVDETGAHLPNDLKDKDVTVVVEEELAIAAAPHMAGWDGGGRYKKKTRKSRRSRRDSCIYV